jgi:competence protein ComEC
LAHSVTPARDVSLLPPGGQTLIGTVADAPAYRDGLWRFVADTEQHDTDAGREAISGRVYVRLKSTRPVTRGERWRLTGRLRPLRQARNPGQRSEAERLAPLGVSAVLTVGSGELAEPLGPGDLGLIARHAFAAQQSALGTLRRYVGGRASETTASTAASVIFGVHSTPPPAEITEAFRRSGTIHLLVVSGAVVSMVFGMVFLPGALGARWRRLYVERQSGWPISYRGRVRLHPGLWAAAIAILVVTYYAILTEGGQAVARAAAMGVLAALALVLRRAPSVARQHGLNVDHFTLLAAAALVVLAPSPQSLFQPGFQLSFAAVAAILYLTPKAMWLVGWLPRWLGYIIVGTLAAQLATFPILVWHFGQAPLAGFGANLLAIPLASLVLAAGMATCALALLAPWAAPAAGWVTGWATRWLVWVSGAFASLPWASVGVPRPNAAVVVVWYLALIGLGRLADRSRGSR